MIKKNKYGLYVPITVKGIFNTIRYWLFSSYRKYVRESWHEDMKKVNDFFEEISKTMSTIKCGWSSNPEIFKIKPNDIFINEKDDTSAN